MNASSDNNQHIFTILNTCLSPMRTCNIKKTRWLDSAVLLLNYRPKKHNEFTRDTTSWSTALVIMFTPFYTCIHATQHTHVLYFVWYRYRHWIDPTENKMVAASFQRANGNVKWRIGPTNRMFLSCLSILQNIKLENRINWCSLALPLMPSTWLLFKGFFN